MELVRYWVSLGADINHVPEDGESAHRSVIWKVWCAFDRRMGWRDSTDDRALDFAREWFSQGAKWRLETRDERHMLREKSTFVFWHPFEQLAQSEYQWLRFLGFGRRDQLEAAAVLRWFTGLRTTEWDGAMTPMVEDQWEKRVGLEKDYSKENFGARLSTLAEELTDRTEWRVRVQPWEGGWAAMNSVKCWEQLRRMGIQSDLHTLATRNHCFQNKAAPGTGSYTWMGRFWEFMNHKGFSKQPL